MSKPPPGLVIALGKPPPESSEDPPDRARAFADELLRRIEAKDPEALASLIRRAGILADR